jgi:glucose-1-phosphate adenylyltransferase
MPNARIGRGVRLYRTIVGDGAVIADGVTIGHPEHGGVTVVGSDEFIASYKTLLEVEPS